MANFIYDTAKRDFAKKVHDWVGDTFKAMLVTSAYVASPDHEFVSSANAAELSGTGYTSGYGNSGRKSLANKTVTIASVTGTAQGGSTTTIQFAAGENATDGYFVGSSVRKTGGTGVNEVGRIISYNGTTKTATVDKAWTVPDGTTTYKITRVVLDADDTTWTALNAGTVAAVIIVKELGGADASSLLIAYIDNPTLPLVTNGGDVTFQWSADGLLDLM